MSSFSMAGHLRHELLFQMIVDPDSPTNIGIGVMTLRPYMLQMPPAFLGSLLRIQSMIPADESKAWVMYESNDAEAAADMEKSLAALRETGELPIRTQPEVYALQPAWEDLAKTTVPTKTFCARNPVWLVTHKNVSIGTLKGLLYRGSLFNSPAADCLAFLGEHVARTGCEACISCPCTGDPSRAPGVFSTCPSGKTNTWAHGLFPIEKLPDGIVPFAP